MKSLRSFIFFAVLALAPIISAGLAASTELPTAADLAYPDHLPPIGKWMISSAGYPANWLGATHEGKELIEPINIILIDNMADSADEAMQRLAESVALAGYPSRFGHSNGYSARIGDESYPQLPADGRRAFSDRWFIIPNNHGRIFGPAIFDDMYIFIGAFSREGIAPFARVKHSYISFNAARDDFAERMDEKSLFRIRGVVDLDNALFDHPLRTTGDHDGLAVVLWAQE